MKVLVYMPFALWTPHFETDLEIAKSHLDAGDEVHVVTCEGALLPCEPNPQNIGAICSMCSARSARGLDRIGLPRESRHPLKPDPSHFEVPEFGDVRELMAFKVGDYRVGLPVASSLISSTRDPRPDVKLHRSQIERGLKSSAGAYRFMRDLIRRLRPDLVYLFNGRFAAQKPCLEAARAESVPYRVHERAGTLDRYSLFVDSIPHDCEYVKREILELWERAKEEPARREVIARSWFEQRRAGKDQSWYSFTRSQDRGALPPGFDRTKRNIVIFNTSEDEVEAIDGWQNPVYRDQADALERILSATVAPDIHFYLRVHPNLRGLDNHQTRQIAALRGSNLTVVPAESAIDSYALLDAATQVLTFGSTVGIEAVYWERPSILVGRAVFEHLGGCLTPASHEEVLQVIQREAPRAAPRDAALQFGYWISSYGHPFKHFVPEGVTGGRFDGRRIRPPLGLRLRAKLARALLDRGIRM